MKKIIIGSRGSKLSLAYAGKVKTLILKKNPDLQEENIKFLTIKTSADIHQDKKISEIGGKNLFCKEIEENLLNKKIDIAVHSLKDMDSQENNKLVIGAYLKRNDPRDVFISKKNNKLDKLVDNIIVGSSSRRRELQLKLINKNISVIHIRGNIDTRIKKLEKEKIDGIVLAAAGIESLDLKNKVNFFFKTEQMLPAVGQGIIAAQCRESDKYLKEILKYINDDETMICASAEREMLKCLGGDCHTAVGGLACIKNGGLELKAQLFSDDGKKSFNSHAIGSKSNPFEVGKKVGKKLLELAGKEFKKNEYFNN